MQEKLSDYLNIGNFAFQSFQFAVIFLENELLYGTQFPVSEEVLSPDFVVPIGKAKIELQGDHVTLVSHSKGVQMCLEAAEQLKAMGVSAEVIFFVPYFCAF